MYARKILLLFLAASGLFLQGHSSDGWATLQLQVNYPKDIWRHMVHFA